MKKNILLPLLFLLIACCFSCKTSKSVVDKNHCPNISVGDSVRSLLGDSVCDVVFGAHIVKLYTLSTDEAGDLDATIGGYKIKDEWGVLDDSYIKIIQFLFSDRKEYFDGIIFPTAPFIPNVALEFINGDNTVDFVFSYSGGQLQIVFNGKKTQVQKYFHERIILLYFQNILKDPEIDKILTVQDF